MKKYGNGYDAKAAREEKEAAKLAAWAKEADAKKVALLFQGGIKTRKPSVYRKGEAVEGTAKVGQLKGADLEALKARLAKRFKK